MRNLLSRLKSEILVVDGAMGTMLMKRGLPAGARPETWNLSHPRVVMSIHRAYADAGADIVTTNTLGGNRIALKDSDLADRVEEVNSSAVRLAREAAGDRRYVAGSVGPTGRFIEPFGPLTFEEAYEAFKEQAHALVRAGVDCLILETMVDLQEVRACLLAVREVGTVPVIAQMAFTPEGRTVTGTDPLTALTVLEGLGADIVGANCQTGPAEMLPIVEEMTRFARVPVIAQPNAGMPELVEGRTVFRAKPGLLAEYGAKFVGLGANLVGSCCGTTPQHTRAIARHVKQMKPKRRVAPHLARICSRTKTLCIGSDQPLCIIGERINPSGRKDLSRDIREGRTDLMLQEARRQVACGAHGLDVNVAVRGTNEQGTMVRAIPALQNAVAAPLVMDTADPEALEAALRLYAGKALINSIAGERSKLEALLPLAWKYGAAFVALCLDEKGIPGTVAGRLAIARRILKSASGARIPPEDILIDGLVLTASTNQAEVLVTLRTLERVRKDLNLSTILGVSNVSFGLPNRGTLNAAYLAMATAYGLDAAIVNPLDSDLMSIARATEVLTGRDPAARVYIGLHPPPPQAEPREEMKVGEAAPKELSLRDAILAGTKENLEERLKRLLDAGQDPLDIVNRILIPAISEVGERFNRREYFLPQVILSAEAMREAFLILRPRLRERKVTTKGRILLATVKGDIHDIGKNIVGTVLRSFGFEVVDLGKDVAREEILRAARRERVQAVGLSALMTTTMGEMKGVVESFREEGLTIPILVGGAVVTAQYAAEIGAAGYAKDALEAVREAERLIGSRW